MIKYKYNLSRYTIEKMEVSKETDKYVVYRDEYWKKEFRERKKSNTVEWHDTWEQAHARLLGVARSRLNEAKSRLDCARSKLEEAERMKEPLE